MEPGSRSLFEAINSFLKLTYMMRRLRMNVPRWLEHVKFLYMSAVKEGILNIQLAYRPSTGKS